MFSPFPPRPLYTLSLPGDRQLHLGERTLVMGILNVTPDSFADAAPLVGGRGVGGVDVARAVARALQMEAEGADLIDVGGESTRPGAEPVSAAEEQARIVPVIEALASRLRVPISVDTTKAAVARQAVAAGAAIVNDISGLTYDPGLAAVVADSGAALVLTHTRGRPTTMYAEAVYVDIVADVVGELVAAAARATATGVSARQIVMDPGIGFAKHAAHSYGVLARLPELQAALDYPLLVGPSRKSFLRQATGDRPPAERDWGTGAAVTAAVLGGAHLIRVHAVAEMVQVVRVADAIRDAAAGAVAMPGTDE